MNAWLVEFGPALFSDIGGTHLEGVTRQTRELDKFGFK